MSDVQVRPLGRLFRSEHCAVCGANGSDRLVVATGLGERVICRNVAACDARSRIPDVRAVRRRRRIRLLEAASA